MQTSLHFETTEEIEVFEQLVKPLRDNNQLRQTLISLLVLYHKHPAVIEGLHRGGQVTVADAVTQELQDKVSLVQTKVDLFNIYLDNVSSDIDQLSPENIDQTLAQFKAFEHSTMQTEAPEIQQMQEVPAASDLKEYIASIIREEMNLVKQELAGVREVTTDLQPEIKETTVLLVPEPEVQDVEEEEEMEPLFAKRTSSTYVLPQSIAPTEEEPEIEEELVAEEGLPFDPLQGVPSFLLDAAEESML